MRHDSGGRGLHQGGDGIVREIEVLTECQVTLLSERRKHSPWGLAGGGTGAPGKAWVIRAGGSAEEMPGKFSARLAAGDRIKIESPGGGAWRKRNEK